MKLARRIVHGHWRWVLTLAVVGLLAWFLVDRAQSIDWDEVGTALRGYSMSSLLGALATALAGYCALSSYDLLARRYTGHGLPARRVLPIAFVGYSFTMNLGTLVGGLGFRYRLYSRYGLKAAQIARVISVVLLTNWSGYVLLLGVMLCLGEPPIPANWQIPAWVQPVVGAALLAWIAGYVVACRVFSGRELHVRRLRLTVPTARFALMQIGASSVSWLMIAATIHQLLPDPVPFTTVLATLFLSGLAGLLAHIPGNIGVLEGVFIAVLGDSVPVPQLIAALLAFRAMYYLLPFTLAVATYLLLEFRAGRRTRAAPGVQAT